jgi:hypothetical protein
MHTGPQDWGASNKNNISCNGAPSLVVMCMVGIKKYRGFQLLSASGNPSPSSSLAHHSLPKNQDEQIFDGVPLQ